MVIWWLRICIVFQEVSSGVYYEGKENVNLMFGDEFEILV